MLQFALLFSRHCSGGDRILPKGFSSPVLVLGVIWCAGFSSYGSISPLSDRSMANTQAF
ncbi:hypothetical protein LC608_31605 [Nostoc sp. XA010]|uniref:hypothetical protein n=1 Tax=Nostoc sp. XA010 TaxID=2780407 RepID=UPI001E3838A2|nr:hypothetical protein [Nostoc sp. XA010]MCC5661420.1 hypothetical protein [Nostoc sp. XA010]